MERRLGGDLRSCSIAAGSARRMTKASREAEATTASNHQRALLWSFDDAQETIDANDTFHNAMQAETS